MSDVELPRGLVDRLRKLGSRALLRSCASCAADAASGARPIVTRELRAFVKLDWRLPRSRLGVGP